MTDTATTDTDDTTTDTTAAGTIGTGTTASTAAVDDGTSATTDIEALRTRADKWKALARKHEQQAKSNAAAAQELAAIKESQKTEHQKLADKLAAAEKELAGYRLNEMRTQAVREAGMDADMAEFLTATDPDSAAKQAKTLARRLAPPKPNLQQGARPTAAAVSQDMNAWLRRQTGHAS
jgi:hypothetical protein